MLFRRPDEPRAADRSAEAAQLAVVAETRPQQTFAAPVVLDGQFSPQSPVPVAAAGLAVGRDGQTPLSLAVADGSAARPDWPGAVEGLTDNQAPIGRYRIHIVHEGDSLERLAERYLGDAARALELFDLNRDVLENPHLLKIGAELRVPGRPDRDD
jgi:nucleoid-associated protein YgaU